MKDMYKKQVALLIDILLEIAKEDNFALHGGTAINLFHLNMPRLSVDIDLTFVPFSDNRNEDLHKIRQSLDSVKNRLKATFPNIRFEDEKRAEEEFNRFCEIKTVSVGQLWGGKLNAALERQHPRDIFDVKNMLQEIDFTEEIKQGFLFFLLCGKRPIYEVLNPNFTNQRVIFYSQFSGMTNEDFTYREFEKIREELVLIVNNSLTDKEKDFLLSFSEGNPNWEDFDYSEYPAIKWKLLNIKKLKQDNPIKFRESIQKLESIRGN